MVARALRIFADLVVCVMNCEFVTFYALEKFSSALKILVLLWLWVLLNRLLKLSWWLLLIWKSRLRLIGNGALKLVLKYGVSDISGIVLQVVSRS